MPPRDTAFFVYISTPAPKLAIRYCLMDQCRQKQIQIRARFVRTSSSSPPHLVKHRTARPSFGRTRKTFDGSATLPGRLRPTLAPVRANIERPRAEFAPKSCRGQPKPPKFGQTCVIFGPNAGIAKNRTKLSHICLNWGRVRPNLLQCGQTYVMQLRPTQPKHRRVRPDIGRSRAEFGRNYHILPKQLRELVLSRPTF